MVFNVFVIDRAAQAYNICLIIYVCVGITEGDARKIHQKPGIQHLFRNTTIPDKIFRTKWSNPVKLYRKKKSGMRFWVFLNCFMQSLSS